MTTRSMYSATGKLFRHRIHNTAAGIVWKVRGIFRKIWGWMSSTVPGIIILTLGLFILTAFTLWKLDYAYHNPHLTRGYVVAKSYYDGHPYSESIKFGDYEIVHHFDNLPEKYSVQVKDGNFLQWWEVSKTQWEALKVNDYVTR